jgi:hypothetical protein
LIFNDFCVLSASRHDMARDMDDMDLVPDHSPQKVQQGVLDHLTDTDEPQTVAEIVAGTGADKNAIDQALRHLVEAGDVITAKTIEAVAIADDHENEPTYTLAAPKPPWLAAAPPQPEGDALVPEGFLPLSSAANILKSKMYGGLPLPEFVPGTKEKFIKEKLAKNLSLDSGDWREDARRRLRQATTENELSVFVIAVAGAKPVQVPAKVLDRLITSRGGLSDHPVPLPPLSVIKASRGDERLYVLMKTGILVNECREFKAWCRLESRKGKWPSQRWPPQRTRLKRPKGRPPKQTWALRDAVLERVGEGKWNGQMGIPSLRRLLASEGEISEDTLGRLIKDLIKETGDSRLRVAKRRKRRRLPQN